MTTAVLTRRVARARASTVGKIRDSSFRMEEVGDDASNDLNFDDRESSEMMR